MSEFFLSFFFFSLFLSPVFIRSLPRRAHISFQSGKTLFYTFSRVFAVRFPFIFPLHSFILYSFLLGIINLPLLYLRSKISLISPFTIYLSNPLTSINFSFCYLFTALKFIRKVLSQFFPVINSQSSYDNSTIDVLSLSNHCLSCMIYFIQNPENLYYNYDYLTFRVKIKVNINKVHSIKKKKQKKTLPASMKLHTIVYIIL